VSKTTRTVEWGYRTPDGRDNYISEESANVGYMSALQFARKRADATRGSLIRREREVTVTEWEVVR
jgi:hypothetical protein